MSALYELFDSDNPLAIPPKVKAAGYDDGYAANAWSAFGWARFPDALHITVFGADRSDIADVETGDLTPAQGAVWAARRKALGKVGIVYVNRANGRALEDGLRAQGLSLAEVLLWIATDDGTQTVSVWNDGSPVYYPVWAVQYLNQAHGSGGHYDRSLVYLAFGAAGGGAITPPSPRRQSKSVASSDSFIVFGLGDDNALWYDRFDVSTGKWAGLASLGGSWLDFDLSGAGQRIDLYARGTTARELWHTHSNDAGVSFAAWEQLQTSGGFKSPVVALGPALASPVSAAGKITLNVPSVPGTATGTIS